MRQILQRAHFVLGQGALPANMKHRAFRAKCRGDTGYRIGAAWTRGRDNTAHLARLAGITIGRMSSDLLVAHVDNADAFIDAAVIDIDDVAAAKREDGVDTFILQRPRHQMATGHHAPVAYLPLQCIFSR